MNKFVEISEDIINIKEIQIIESDVNNPFEFKLYLKGRQFAFRYIFGSKRERDEVMNHIKKILF